MIVGILTVELSVTGAQSLKDKRRVLSGIKERLKGRFNASVAEIDYNDKWQKAALGIAVVGNEKAFVNSALDKIMDFLRVQYSVGVSDYTMELL